MNRDEDWHDNDGALNTVSMTHPRIPAEHPSHLVVDDSECQPLQPGIWFVTLLTTNITTFIAFVAHLTWLFVYSSGYSIGVRFAAFEVNSFL